MSQQKNKSSASPPPPEMDGRFQRLLSLLGLLKEARHKARKTELEFMMVNQTFNLVPYRHCIFWEWDGDHVSIRTASGLVQVDPTGPYTLWLKKVIVSQLPRDTSGQAPENAQEKPAPEGYSVLLEVSQDDCRPQERSEWKKWSSTRVLLAVMKDRHKKTIGGLWLDREEPFDELERAMLEDLCDGYAHALHRYQERHGVSGRFHWRKLFKLSGKNLRIACIALSLLMLLPVHISVTAPAEVVAHEPFVISIPFDGTIGSIEVKPGQTVKAGDVLLRMDSTVLQNKVEIAQSEMLTAEIALRKTEREALTDREKLAEIAVLKSRLEQKSAEQEFARQLLDRSEIKAEKDGIAVFSDPNALRGKPVQTGEQVMLLTDPHDSDLMIRVPVEAMIDIDETIPAKFFLNIMPIGHRKAYYESIGYQATPDSDGLMTYKIRARFAQDEEKPRIGWTGTAKIYGERTILLFNILRRPLVTLRQKLGI